MICGITGGDKVVSSARLCLQSNQCIVLDETCKGLLFSDMSFMGKELSLYWEVNYVLPAQQCDYCEPKV